MAHSGASTKTIFLTALIGTVLAIVIKPTIMGLINKTSAAA